MSHSHVTEACLKGCKSTGISSRQAEACGIWHQSVGLGADRTHPSCEDYVSHYDPCLPLDKWPLITKCDRDGRVVGVAGVLHLTQAGLPGACVAHWGGVLSPPLATLGRLHWVLLSSPPPYARLSPGHDVVSSPAALGNCSSVKWRGLNLSGSIPPEWGNLEPLKVDLGGNPSLTGEVPAGWLEAGPLVQLTGTRLGPLSATRELCQMDCGDPRLSGHQRDPCGVWYQWANLASRDPFLLPKCEQYILSSRPLCPEPLKSKDTANIWMFRGQVHTIEVFCDSEGRLVALQLHPLVERAPPWPASNSTSQLAACRALFGGSLAPELSCCDRLRGVFASAFAAGTLVSNCTSVIWQGGNLTGSIPHEWNRLRVNLMDVSGKRGLVGEVPERWAAEAYGLTLHIVGTQVRRDPECLLDCFSLTGPPRDRCGLWYQLRELAASRVLWLPPCNAFVESDRVNCPYDMHDAWVKSIEAARRQPIVRIGIQGMTRRMGRKHHVLYHCDSNDRITHMDFTDIVLGDRGQYMVSTGGPFGEFYRIVTQRQAPNMLPGARNGLCTVNKWGQLAPQVGALDQLQGIVAQAGTSSLTGLERMTGFQCDDFIWRGDNLTGTIPPEWNRLSRLSALALGGNQHLSGTLPASLTSIRKDVYSGTMILGTNITPPIFGPRRAAAMCKMSQRSNGGFLILHAQHSWAFTVNIEKSMFEGSLFTLLYSFAGPGLFYCGKDDQALLHVALAWGVFLSLLIIISAMVYLTVKTRAKRGRRVARSKVGQIMQRIARKWTQLWETLRTPTFVLAVIYDLVTDLLLAYSMYPSWTTWLVLVGVCLPNAICAGALTAHGMVAMRRSGSCGLKVGSMGLFIFLFLLATFPAVSLVLILGKMRGWQWTSGGLGRHLPRFDLDRLAILYTGLTACTEDVFVTIFTTSGFILMAQAPWVVNWANIYFAVWSFWLSMLTSMVHMLMFWRRAMECILSGEVRVSVREAFTTICDHRGIPTAPALGKAAASGHPGQPDGGLTQGSLDTGGLRGQNIEGPIISLSAFVQDGGEKVPSVAHEQGARGGTISGEGEGQDARVVVLAVSPEGNGHGAAQMSSPLSPWRGEVIGT